jgi:ABC-2 type transport system permease protein
MRRLIEIELAKLASREFVTLALVYAALLPIAVASMAAFRFEAPNGAANVNPLGFPDVWANAAYVAGWIDYLLYLFVLQAITLEYHWRTNRQNVIDGLTRTEYVVGKVCLLTLAALVSTALVFAVAAAFGAWSGGVSTGRWGAGSLVVARHFPQVLGYLSLAFLIATLARRSAVAVLAFLAYTLVAEPLMGGLVLPPIAARWLPSHVFASLVPNPLFGYVGMRAETSEFVPIVIVSLAWIFVLIAGTAGLFARQDL